MLKNPLILTLRTLALLTALLVLPLVRVMAQNASVLPVAAATSDAPQIQVTLSRSTYAIQPDPKTGAPRMPRDVVATAEVRNWPADVPKPTVFLWHVFLDWSLPGWEGFTTHHPIVDKVFTAPSPFHPDLSNAIRGGSLVVYAKTNLRGQEIFGTAKAQIVGVNPSRRAILAAFPVSKFGLLASKIGMAESGLRQFTESGKNSLPGMPVVSSSGDIGLMQLNAPTGAVTTAEQVWDWRANLRQGMGMLAGKHRTSVTVARRVVGRGWQRPAEIGLQNLANLNAVRLLFGLAPLPAPAAPPLSTQPGSGILPGEPDPDHLALNQLERDGIRRYNGGREYAFTIVPDPNKLEIARAGWEVDPTRGGMSQKSGAIDYVRRVLAARSGMIYPPPKPKVTAKAKSSHRRVRRHRTK